MVNWWLSFVFLFAFAASMVGCAGADSAFKVKGKVIVPSGMSVENCVLERRAHAGGRVLDWQSVDGSFFVTFMVKPGEVESLLSIRCPGLSGVRTFGPIKTSGLKSYKDPIDLGVIEMTR
jgi:hypothetical protein